MLNKLILLSVVVLLAACGGGGGGAASGDTAPERPEGSVSGLAHDGPISSASVNIYSVTSSGKANELLATGTTNSSGEFSIEVQARDQWVLIEVSGGSYTEESTGRSVSLNTSSRRDEVLKSYVYYVSAEAVISAVTAYTHLGAGLVEFLIDQGGSLDDAINAAYAEVDALAGLDVRGTMPLDATDEANEFNPVDADLEYGVLLAGLSELSKRLNEDAGESPHALYTTFDLIQLMHQDIRVNGLLDGYGAEEGVSPSTLLFAGESITPATFREDLAESVLMFVQSDANALAIESSDILNFTVDMASANDGVFASEPREIDNSGPTIAPSIENNAEVEGETTITYTAEDLVGIASLTYYLDGQIIAQETNLESPSLTIDTDDYDYGDHVITVVATDNLGNETEETYGIYFMPPAGLLAGVAHDAPIVGADVRAYEHGTTTQIGSAETDEFGDYELTIQATDTAVDLEVTGGYYTEEFSGERVSLGAGQSLKGRTFYEVGSGITLSLTQYTHWSVCYQDYLIEEQNFTVGNAFVQASEVFTNLAGVEISAVRPVDITNPNDLTAFETPAHLYGYLLAAWSGVSAEIAEQNGVEPHSGQQYTSIYLADLICQDVRYDGLLDGFAAPTVGNESGQLYVGTVALSPDFYRTVLAQKILEVAVDTEINQVGLTPEDLLVYANSISTNNNALFGGAPSRPVDIEGPIITSPTVAGTLVNGQPTISFAAEDPIGVIGGEYYIDSLFVGYFEEGNLDATFNSTLFGDGEHNLNVIIRDALNNESEFSLPLVFINTGAGISFDSDTLVNSTAYTASGEFMDVGAPIESIVVNGVEAAFNTQVNTWSADITLVAGVNTITAVITDTLGNTNQEDLSVSVDTDAPEINPENSPASFETGQGELNQCDPGVMILGDTSFNQVCLSTDFISLSGQAVTRTLDDIGYTALYFTVNDFEAEVSTSARNVTVEYRYYRNNFLIQDWTPVPFNSANPSEKTLPLTTEYLGEGFFQTDISVNHTIVVRAIDAAGNSSESRININFAVYTDSLDVGTVSVANPEVFDRSFTDRSTLRYEDVLIEQEVINDKPVAYYIRVTPNNAHTLDHVWEEGTRLHVGSERRTETWRRGKITASYQVLDLSTEGYNAWTGFGAASEVTELNAESFYNYTSVGWELVSPPEPTFSDPESVSTDNPTVQATIDWTSFHIDDDFGVYDTLDNCRIYVDYADSDSAIQGPPSHLVFDSSWTVGYSAPHETSSSVNYCTGWNNEAEHHYLERHVAYEWISDEGYPRNDITTDQREITFDEGDVQVLIDDVIIGDTNGWYLIPANTTAVIRKTVELPTFTIHNDLSIGRDDESVPYDSIDRLDLSLDWSLDTSFTIERSIASENGLSDDVVVHEQSVDNAPETATLSR